MRGLGQVSWLISWTLTISIYPSIYLPIYRSVIYLSVYLSTYIICMYIYIFIFFLFFFLSLSISIIYIHTLIYILLSGSAETQAVHFRKWFQPEITATLYCIQCLILFDTSTLSMSRISSRYCTSAYDIVEISDLVYSNVRWYGFIEWIESI